MLKHTPPLRETVKVTLRVSISVCLIPQFQRNSLKLPGRCSWNSPGSFCPNSLLLPTQLGPGYKTEEFLIYSRAKSTDMDWNYPADFCLEMDEGLLLCFVLTVGSSHSSQGITASTWWQQFLQLFWLALQGFFGLYFKGIRVFVCPVISKSQCVCHRCDSQAVL